MIHNRELDTGGWIAPAFVAFAGMVGIPFYFGVIHLPIVQLLVYSPFAGAAMTAGTHLDSLQGELGKSIGAIMAGVGFWTILTLMIGATSYLVALVF